MVTTMSNAAQKISKKPYQRPRLVTYGALREITQAVGIYMRLDGGTANMMKRSQATDPFG